MTTNEPKRSVRTVACIPAFNEEKSIASVIVKTKKYVDLVMVVDDGSTDSTAEIAEALGVRLIRHGINKGKGAALRTLFTEARKMNPVAVISIDADGQHSPSDIPRVASPVLNGEADIVVGVREMRDGGAPRHRIVGNSVLDAITSAKAGGGLRDTQSGFRAYSINALSKIDFEQQGMAIESQTLIDAAKAGLRILEISVAVTYEGIAKKRNSAKHLSEVVDYILTRTVVDNPLLYLGFPGLIAIVIGIGTGVQVLNVFTATRLIALGTALIAVGLTIVGTIMVATSLILKLIRAQLQ